MKYKPGEKVMYKNYESKIVFCYENYKDSKNAYTIKFQRGNIEVNRLCYEDELERPEQMDIWEFISDNT
ncbi:MAG: hypothetical protein BWY74_00131 [Firmicutes bacterium ADurb.Bin419]|nr:MAG: hypothetical protein BWY74_00131 [Firmicutes bacterium ADurb.Bin419]